MANIDPGDDPPRLSTDDGADSRRWLALAVLCLSLVLITVDNTVLNVALPTLVRDLHASNSQLQWIVDSYQLVFAGLLFSAGSMADRYGRKGMLSLGLAVFGLGTAASAVAGSANVLIVTRAFMGIGGAMIMPSTLSILGAIFPDASERTRAIAIWAAMGAVGVAVGPVLGGLLLAHFGWGSIFAVNIPLVVAALVGGHLLLPRSKDPSPGRLDPVGALLSILTLIALVFAVIEGPDRGWSSATVLGAAGVAVMALGAFIAWESRHPDPMLDLQLFRDRRFTVGALTLMLLYFGALGTYFLYTQHLQFVLGYSALQAGVYSVPFAVVVVFCSLQTPRIVERFGTGRVAGTGLLILAAGAMLRATADAHTGYALLLVSLVITAFGVGTTIAPSTASIMTALPPAKSGVGSAMNDASRQVGAAAGVAVLGSIWASSYHHVLSGATLRTQVPAAALRASRTSVGAALASARPLPVGPRGDLVAATKAAFVHGSNVANVVAAVVAVAGAMLAFRYLPAPPRTADESDEVVDLVPLPAASSQAT
ncbi:MAG TPA: DHA2 family efflux MFS transporter permease subunit [Acidimicrobiales bacterium]|nr:DHA2 family efflux MFS transporter permease subunit [Acidimicrobiales bacterium]